MEVQMYLQQKAAQLSWSQTSEECLACHNQDVGAELVDALIQAQIMPHHELVSSICTSLVQEICEAPPHLASQEGCTDRAGLESTAGIPCKQESKATFLPCVPIVETLSDRVSY